MKTSNKVLAVLGIFLLIFITTMIIIFCVKGAVPDTLIQYVLGAGGIESLALAGIKIAKTKWGYQPPDEEEIKDGADHDERHFVCGFDGSASSDDEVRLPAGSDEDC